VKVLSILQNGGKDQAGQKRSATLVDFDGQRKRRRNPAQLPLLYLLVLVTEAANLIDGE
jgi:hypothetical protein